MPRTFSKIPFLFPGFKVKVFNRRKTEDRMVRNILSLATKGGGGGRDLDLLSFPLVVSEAVTHRVTLCDDWHVSSSSVGSSSSQKVTLSPSFSQSKL